MVSEFQSIHINYTFLLLLNVFLIFLPNSAESLYIFGLIVSGRNVCFLYFNQIFVGL